MHIIICDIDGSIAEYPEEAVKLFRERDPNICGGCQDLTSENKCIRRSRCENEATDIRLKIDAIFTPEKVIGFRPIKEAQERLFRAKWNGDFSLVYYVSSRPIYLLQATQQWLISNRFPLGIIALLGSIPGKPEENKINFVQQIVNSIDEYNKNNVTIIYIEDDINTAKLYESRFGAINLMGENNELSGISGKETNKKY